MKKIVLIFVLFLIPFCLAGTYHPNIDSVFPHPESKFITTHTTIILKLDETLNDQITNLSTLISVKSENGASSGETFFSTDNRTIIFKPEEPLPKNAKIDVTIQTSQFGSADFSYSFYTPADNRNEMDWLPKQSASSENEIGALAPVRLINGVAVPSDFPDVSVNIIGETAPGRLFIPANKWIIIFENDGTPYFYRKYEDGREKMRFEAHPSGHLSFFSHEVYDVILDQNFVEIDTVTPGHGYLPDDHELQILENGHMLLVARDRVRVDMSTVVSGGNNNATVEAHHVQELDRDHNVIFEWNNWNHLDIRETDVSIRGGFVDFVHTNSIAVDYDGHLILSPREYNMIMKIDRITAETIWKLGGDNSDFEFINDDIDFSRIHDVRPVPGKPNQYTLFDNGRDRKNGGKFSRAVEYKLDLDAMTAEKVWEYRHNPDIFSAYCGGTQPLENGNRFISWANHDYFTEVNSNGELVYEMHVSGFSCSRARRSEWDGMMLHPYLIVENMGSIVRLIFNKFGDDNVAYYNIYAGTNENSLALFDSTKQTYMDINALDLGDGARYFFKVTAVDGQGNESDASKVENALIRIIAPGENAVQDGDFQSTDSWNLRRRNGANATGKVNADGYYEINISKGGSNLNDVQLRQDNLLVMQSKDYVFEFDAYASRTRAIGAKVVSEGSSPVNYGNIGNTAITTRSQHFTFEFPMRHPTDTKARILFNCGGTTGDVFIDNVSLTYKDITDDLSPLPGPWKNMDIGSPAIAGLAGMQGDRFLIRGSGDDIWNQRDAFHFVYQEIEGDMEIIAQVYSLDETHPWSKAGVMMRNSLKSTSRHAMMIMSAQNGSAFQRRIKDHGNSTHTKGTDAQTPHWVRLIREGNIFTGYESSDGKSWKFVDSEIIDMNKEILVGLPVTSHNDGVVCEAWLDNVDLFTESKVVGNDDALPSSFQLYPAFPNPFNPKTTIQYDIPAETDVTLAIYDVQGRKVHTLENEHKSPGTFQVEWDGLNSAGVRVASGLYFVRMTAGEFYQMQKMTVLK